jgi:hypothetical protein
LRTEVPFRALSASFSCRRDGLVVAFFLFAGERGSPLKVVETPAADEPEELSQGD